MHSNVTPTYAFILKPDFYFKVYESDTKIYTLQQAKNSPKYHCEKKGRRVIGEGDKGAKGKGTRGGRGKRGRKNGKRKRTHDAPIV